MEIILNKEVKPFGTGAHISINKEYLGRIAKVVIQSPEEEVEKILNSVNS
jgi:putative transposon-encoded protein